MHATGVKRKEDIAVVHRVHVIIFFCIYYLALEREHNYEWYDLRRPQLKRTSTTTICLPQFTQSHIVASADKLTLVKKRMRETTVGKLVQWKRKLYTESNLWSRECKTANSSAVICNFTSFDLWTYFKIYFIEMIRVSRPYVRHHFARFFYSKLYSTQFVRVWTSFIVQRIAVVRNGFDLDCVRCVCACGQHKYTASDKVMI